MLSADRPKFLASLRHLASFTLVSAIALACADIPQLISGDSDSADSGTDNPTDDVGQGGGISLDGDSDDSSPPPPSYVCGNAKLEPGEFCDDGNTKDGDGCSKDCQTQDPDYDCSKAGEKCVALSTCGNGVIEGNEKCDDANTSDGPVGVGDGCSADCKTEQSGWSCLRPGKPCVIEPVCGNGKRERGEGCDEGAQSSGGCVDCQITDANAWWCPSPGALCVEKVCGNGVRTPGEECDDGDNDNGDGCNSTCHQESGWTCTDDGCRAKCGDGVVQANTSEKCDLGSNNGKSAYGCTKTCTVKLGWKCTGNVCTQTVCGQNGKETGEGCDDGNTVAGDGCGPTCQAEPDCSNGTCKLTCGDGLVTKGEDCDDGNTLSGDGCSGTTCKVEAGFNCDNSDITYPPYVDFAVTLRDFKAHTVTGGHPDFETGSVGDANLVGAPCLASSSECTAAAGSTCGTGTCGYLDSDRVPVFHRPGKGHINSAASFKLWYFGTNSDNAVVGEHGAVSVKEVTGKTLRLTQVVGKPDTYRFSSDALYPLGDTNAGIAQTGFGPTCGEIDPDGPTATGGPDCCNNSGVGNGNAVCQGRDYNFTTQLRYFFQYSGHETLTFRGDDDVWVFINGRLAVDISGIHGAESGRVILGDDGDNGGTNYDATEDSNCSVHKSKDNLGNTVDVTTACALSSNEEAGIADDKRFDLKVGGVYEIVLFHAERQTTASNFDLTLAGFLSPRSSCESFCGVNPDNASDTAGHVAATEACDDGAANSNTVYNACKIDCSGRIECGDGVKQAAGGSVTGADEYCDDGFNRSLYDDGSNACGVGCQRAPYCGDGTVQDAEEDCDDPAGNTGVYDGCTGTCTWGPYCGDGIANGTVDHPELCDDGENNLAWSPDGTGCSWDCDQPAYCGDGKVYPREEECDEPDSTPGKAYGGCTADCKLEPRCGDGKVQKDQGEQCDDGPIGSLACSPTCVKRAVITK